MRVQVVQQRPVAQHSQVVYRPRVVAQQPHVVHRQLVVRQTQVPSLIAPIAPPLQAKLPEWITPASHPGMFRSAGRDNTDEKNNSDMEKSKIQIEAQSAQDEASAIGYSVAASNRGLLVGDDAASSKEIHAPVVGELVSVTTDAVVFEQECRKSGLNWPSMELARSKKIGKSGKVLMIALSDATVKVGAAVDWVPIRSLVGFQDHLGAAAETQQKAEF